MGQNRKKLRKKSYLIIHIPTSSRVSEVSERSERASERVSAAERASEASRAEQAQRVSGASERANGRASGPVLTSLFFFVPDHCVMIVGGSWCVEWVDVSECGGWVWFWK